MCQFVFFCICIWHSFWNTPIAFNQQDRLSEIVENIEKVESAANTLEDPFNIIKVKARAASLLWKIDRDIGKLRFSSLWEWMNNSTLTPLIVSKAKTEILAQLYVLDSEQVNLLLRTSLDANNSTEAVTLSDKLKGAGDQSAHIRTNIAIRVIDSNPEVAASLIVNEIKQGYSYQLHSAILQLASKDQQLANKVVAQFLGVIDQSSPGYSIVALQHLFGYFFHKGVAGDFIERPNRDQALRDLYLRLSIRVLEKSLVSENGKHSSIDQRLVEVSQSVLAFQLRSVVGKLLTLEPESIKKAYLLSEKLRMLVPQDLEGIFSLDNKGESQKTQPHQRVTPGIDPAIKSTYDNLIKRSGILSSVRDMISLKQYADALVMIQKIDDRQQQLDLLNNLRRSVKSENEPNFSCYITELIISSLDDLPLSEHKVEVMFQLIGTENLSLNRHGERQFWSLFATAIQLVNVLPSTSGLAGSDLFRNAIIKATQIDKQETLNRISEIRSGVFDLMAMLAVNESDLNLALSGARQRAN